MTTRLPQQAALQQEFMRNFPTDVLEVDPTSPSGLRWKVAPARNVRAGSPAGTKNSHGHWQVSYRKHKCFMAHRIVLELSGQPCPGKGYECDHRDKDPGNNRVENLRWVPPGVLRCRRRRTLSRFGLKYVHLLTGYKDRYRYTFKVNGIRYEKAGYTTPTEAHTAALAHRLELFWNP